MQENSADVQQRYPWLSAQQQQVWRTYLELTGRLQEYLDRDLRRTSGIAHAYYQVLAMLSEAPNHSLRMAELAAAAYASPSRMSHAVGRLEKLGWVVRQPSAEDGRGLVATLTDEGFAQIVELAPRHASIVRHIMFDSLSAEQLAVFGDIFAQALQQLAGADEIFGADS